MEGINQDRLIERLRQALNEDIGIGDITAESVVEFNPHAQAEIIARQDGILAGIEIAKMLFELDNPPLDIVVKARDGEAISERQQLMTLEGSGAAILKSERTALNLLGRLSGIATLTHQYVQTIEGTNARILDTRKTTPLWRDVEKYAVRVGGGVNHRMGLYDMVLIKENHIRWAGGLEPALSYCVDELGSNRRSVKIEVEVRSLEELQTVLQYEVDRILLDNMTVEEVKNAVDMVRHKIALEVSGGISLETIRAYAETGVEYISIGALTHSVHVLDVSLLFKEAMLAPGKLVNS